MIIGIGIDLIEVNRIKESIDKYGTRFLNKIFTENEQAYSDQFGVKKYVHYAARFATKEAFSKAIGTGVTQGFKFKNIAIKNIEFGKPILELHDEMLERYGHLKSHISLTHTDTNAAAVVVLEDIN
ncbi:MAG: holo-ACP synthase [Candidatus Kapabacteria bacterium]|jgi:holo-[acyl-carrier protein] synthase|nr:holo-ACP synthase [Candidatus Kapabacteria bacterium]